MEGVVNVEWHGQDYLHLKWHVVCSGLATPGLDYNKSFSKLIIHSSTNKTDPSRSPNMYDYFENDIV